MLIAQHIRAYSEVTQWAGQATGGDKVSFPWLCSQAWGSQPEILVCPAVIWWLNQNQRFCGVQLGQFLGPQVDKVGGMMAMADVYCLFNRARGTELVSPDDLLQACTCFPQAGVPLRIKEFSTGALAVQSQSHSTEQVREHTMQCTVR